jgi:hypothetical protein
VITRYPFGDLKRTGAHRHPIIGRIVHILKLTQGMLGQYQRKAG